MSSLFLSSASKSGTGKTGPQGPAGLGISSITYDDPNDKWIITYTDTSTTQISYPNITLDTTADFRLYGVNSNKKLVVKDNSGNSIFTVDTLNNICELSASIIKFTNITASKLISLNASNEVTPLTYSYTSTPNSIVQYDGSGILRSDNIASATPNTDIAITPDASNYTSITRLKLPDQTVNYRCLTSQASGIVSSVGFSQTVTGSNLVQRQSDGSILASKVYNASGIMTIQSSTQSISLFSNTGVNFSGHLAPASDNAYNLGSATFRLSNIYCTNAVIQTSDLNDKKDIIDSQLGLDFITQLRPVSYKFIYNQSNRTHYGLIAQEVKTVLDSMAITSKDFAGYIRDVSEKDSEGNEVIHYGLRYSEFICPIIKAIQELNYKVDMLINSN
jgi:hypothetical protein